MILRVLSTLLIAAAAASAQMVNVGNVNLVSFIENVQNPQDTNFSPKSCAVREFAVGNELCPYVAKIPRGGSFVSPPEFGRRDPMT